MRRRAVRQANIAQPMAHGRHRIMTLLACTSLVSAAANTLSKAESFSNPASWSSFQLGRGASAFGFDGRYLYAAADYLNDESGTIVRFDIASDFADPGSWTVFDPGANGVGLNKITYGGEAAFDGTYLYFTTASYTNPPSYSNYVGEVLRYDTRQSFSDLSSWAAYDFSLHCQAGDNCDSPKGYTGAVFDGRYVYFAPDVKRIDGTVVRHGEVLRLDTNADFQSEDAWATYDYGSDPNGCAQQLGCVDPDGYSTPIYDGRYVYFPPNYNEQNPITGNGEVLRYDTLGAFGEAESWTTFNPGVNGVGNDPRSYFGAVFDGRYLYFVPNKGDDLVGNGEVLRFDTRSEFSNAGSWSVFNPSASGMGNSARGYHHGTYDGRFVYFSPSENENGFHSDILRYDTDGTFDDISSWSLFNPNGEVSGLGMGGIVNDSRFIYFLPGRLATGTEKVHRYDTSPDANCVERLVGDIAPCGGDGIVNLDDILAVLEAFSGTNACPEECVVPQ